MSILRQRGVTLDHGDQKTGTFLWIQVAANCSLGLSSSQERSYSFLPGKENPFQTLAELLVHRRHFRRQIEQWTTGSNVFGPNRHTPDNANQDVNWLSSAKQRAQPPVANNLCDDFVDDGISKSFFAIEVMIERSLGDIGGGENCIDAGTLEA
nr:hypothetical protein [Acidicapsa acidisoli]